MSTSPRGDGAHSRRGTARNRNTLALPGAAHREGRRLRLQAAVERSLARERPPVVAGKGQCHGQFSIDARRKRRGVVQVWRRKTSVKCPCVWKPTAEATCTSGRRDCASSSFARSTRRCVRYACGDWPVASLKSPREVERAHVRGRGEIFDVQRLGERALDERAHAVEASRAKAAGRGTRLPRKVLRHDALDRVAQRAALELLQDPRVGEPEAHDHRVQRFATGHHGDLSVAHCVTHAHRIWPRRRRAIEPAYTPAA